MKRFKTVFWFKLGLILLTFFSLMYFIYRQMGKDERNLSSFDYSHANTVTQVIPGGIMTGVYAETNGVLCLGTGTIEGSNGDIPSPAEGVIKKGDYIISCNGKKLESKEELIAAVSACEGKRLQLVILRDKREMEVFITPVLSNGEYRLGIWVRDDIAGIGMITYVTSELQFAALGHAITDMDLGVEMVIREGSIHNARLTDITKGTAGSPGQLIGYINYRASKPEGYIYHNSDCGIRGELNRLPEELEDVSYVSIGSKEDVKRGPAILICDVSGERVAYDIEIEKIFGIFATNNKDYTIRITDERLLALTGGIVQGMSGSPIIQDGKLIGAVTHVLVDDPTKGYGIFIERMMK